MRLLTAISAFLAITVFLVSTADAQWGRRQAPRYQGLEVMGGAGLNMCMDSGDATCDNIDANAAIFLAAGYRFSAMFGLYLDFNYGWFSVDEGDSPTSMQVMPTARFFGVLKGAEFFGGIGFGYSQLKLESGDSSLTWSSWTNLKLEVGGDIEISRNLYLGAAVEYVFNMNEMGEICVESQGQERCADNEGDINDALQILGFVKYRF